MADDALNRAALQIELARAFSDTTSVLSAAATLIGVELGLFDILAGSPEGLDAGTLARRSGHDAAFVSAWLESQIEAGILRKSGDAFLLDEEHRAMFGRAAGPNDVLGLYMTAVGLCGDLPRIVHSIRAGTRLADADLSILTRNGFARLAEVRADRWLDEWIGIVPAVARALERGIAVADVGGGSGALARRLIARYPACRVVVVDPHAGEEALDGVTVERTTFDRVDERFDLILSVETFHHFTDPADDARAVRQRLRDPNSRWLIIESLSREPGLLRRHLASMSALYCAPTVIGVQPPLEGSLIRPEAVITVLREAGFSEVRVAGTTPQHSVIEARS